MCQQPCVADPRLTAAEACTEEANRLERLACFDGFATPLALYQPGAGEPRVNRSERWRQAFALAGKGDASGVIYRNTGATAGHLVTVTALGAKPPRPVLTLQCHNNITELAVMLPEPINRERVNVALSAERAWWRVRDEGLVVSAGRGLPAIRTVLAMVREPDTGFRPMWQSWMVCCLTSPATRRPSSLCVRPVAGKGAM